MRRRKRENQVLIDTVKVMCVELDQLIKSNDMRRVYRMASKWETLLKELIEATINGG